MTILVFPVLDYVCANCSHHMFSEGVGAFFKGQPTKERIIYCINDHCEMNMKKVKIKAIELEIEEE